jgi:predicted AlkP superfamily pyrophosphatase or phosphodiesterase
MVTARFALSVRILPRPFRALALFTALVACSLAAVAQQRPVLMISIDGLKPEYITHADEHGLKIPTLRRFVTEGTYADGVIGVMPTVTYPSHTTLMTGVSPAVHGIYNNQVFDPTRDFSGAWYWYNDDVRVPTLWQAAHEHGLSTASVSWPVSVNAKGVDYLIPEYWRVSVGGTVKNNDDRFLMGAISRPVGMLAEMEQKLGPYMAGNDTSVENGDRVRTKFSLEIIRTKKPQFMTIHLSAMDGSEHEYGVFSAEANATLEAVDGMVKELIDAAMANDPKTVVAIVSDHGFTNTPKAVNLAIPFIEAGLVKLGKSPMGATHVTEWQAEPWMGGGMAAIMLHDPANTQVREQVRGILDKIAADPANGVDRILGPEEIRKYGGFPDAAFVVVMKIGYLTGGGLSGAMVTDSPEKGAHGFMPDFPDMHASFFLMGSGLAHGKDLGTIDMRRIAPTIAGIIGASLPTAKEAPLDVAGK